MRRLIITIPFLCLALASASAQSELTNAINQKLALEEKQKEWAKRKDDAEKKLDMTKQSEKRLNDSIILIQKEIEERTKELDKNSIKLLKDSIDGQKKLRSEAIVLYNKYQDQQKESRGTVEGLVSEVNVYSSTYSADQVAQRFEEARKVLGKLYSETTESEIKDIETCLKDYKQMEGYTDFQSRFDYYANGWNIYQKALKELEDGFDHSLNNEIMTALESMVNVKKDDLKKAQYMLNEGQSKECDSMRKLLSRYMASVKLFQDIIGQIRELRKGMQGAGEAEQKAAKEKISTLFTPQKDSFNDKLIEQGINRIPFLRDRFTQYKNSVLAAPTSGSNIEDEIMSVDTK
ncbi:MAG: hypothetical protein KBT39_09890 [Bacteroidales bacterium]|nr:hypothetical protein [Bacteroidales bacterium]